MRDAGRLMHPQPRAQKKQHVRARVFTAEAPESPAIPHAMVLLSMPCSPRGGALLRPSSCGRWLVGPGWGRRTSARNYPSVRGGTTRFKSPQRASFVVRNLSSAHSHTSWCIRPANSDHARYHRVHRISSRVRDDRDTPLGWNETAILMRCFEQKGNRNIFGSGAGQPRNTLGTQTSNAEFITF